MIIITKLKNWIITALGGYTSDEVRAIENKNDKCYDENVNNCLKLEENRKQLDQLLYAILNSLSDFNIKENDKEFNEKIQTIFIKLRKNSKYNGTFTTVDDILFSELILNIHRVLHKMFYTGKIDDIEYERIISVINKIKIEEI